MPNFFSLVSSSFFFKKKKFLNNIFYLFPFARFHLFSFKFFHKRWIISKLKLNKIITETLGAWQRRFCSSSEEILYFNFVFQKTKNWGRCPHHGGWFPPKSVTSVILSLSPPQTLFAVISRITTMHVATCRAFSPILAT